LSYDLAFEAKVLDALEDLGHADVKRMRQMFLKMLALRRTPLPQDAKQLVNFRHKGMTAYRVDQGEYRIVYAVDEKSKKVYLAYLLHRGQEYREIA